MYTDKNIHIRIYRFVLRVINFTKHLPLSVANQRIILQLIDSVTSVGANDQEADGSQSSKDFIAKYSIAKKEAKETLYWIKLLYDTNQNLQKRMLNLLQENEEIIKIISAIIISTKNKK